MELNTYIIAAQEELCKQKVGPESAQGIVAAAYRCWEEKPKASANTKATDAAGPSVNGTTAETTTTQREDVEME